jgi:hypothetical protein
MVRPEAPSPIEWERGLRANKVKEAGGNGQPLLEEGRRCAKKILLFVTQYNILWQMSHRQTFQNFYRRL